MLQDGTTVSQAMEPGILPIQQWRPDPGAEPLAEVNTYGGIGRKG